MHKDVKEAIYSYQLDVMLEDARSGKYVDPNFVVDTLSIGLSVNHESFMELAKKYETAMNRIMNLQKQTLRDRRIVDLFLRNHGNNLDWEYDRFEARIYDKLYEKGLI